MIVVDANILVSAVMGSTWTVLTATAERVPLAAPTAQIAEARRVLARLGHEDAGDPVVALLAIVAPLDDGALDAARQDALDRLHPRGAPDWPVLAAALIHRAAIWSHDRDLFGTGVPVWSTRNIRFAPDEAGPSDEDIQHG